MYKLSFNLESTVLAIHCSIDDQEQVLFFTRSNWKWFCKQQVLIDSSTDRLKSLLWVKKYQLCTVSAKGVVEFTEYKFEYMTSATNCNSGEAEDHGYVAVVDGPAVNLTPMGKFVMPPPMFEKQISLPYVPKSLALYNHTGVAYVEAENSLYRFDCIQGEPSLQRFGLEALPEGFKLTTVLV